MKKKYATFKGSLGFSNATAPAASNGPATKKANKSTRTNKPPISKIGRTATAFFVAFIFPEEQKQPIYPYPYSGFCEVFRHLNSEILCKLQKQTAKSQSSKDIKHLCMRKREQTVSMVLEERLFQ